MVYQVHNFAFLLIVNIQICHFFKPSYNLTGSTSWRKSIKSAQTLRYDSFLFLKTSSENSRWYSARWAELPTRTIVDFGLRDWMSILNWVLLTPLMEKWTGDWQLINHCCLVSTHELGSVVKHCISFWANLFPDYQTGFHPLFWMPSETSSWNIPGKLFRISAESN